MSQIHLNFHCILMRVLYTMCMHTKGKFNKNKKQCTTNLSPYTIISDSSLHTEIAEKIVNYRLLFLLSLRFLLFILFFFFLRNNARVQSYYSLLSDYHSIMMFVVITFEIFFFWNNVRVLLCLKISFVVVCLWQNWELLSSFIITSKNVCFSFSVNNLEVQVHL